MTKQPPRATWPGGAGGDNPAITGLRVVLAEDDVLVRDHRRVLVVLTFLDSR
jgi:hypothetical protein